MKIKLLFIALLFLRGCVTCPAQTYRVEIGGTRPLVFTNHVPVELNPAVRAIIGEAASEPYRTQLAIASAIRNRGTLNGVLGLRNAKMIDAQTPRTFAIAMKAWNESATNNIVQGATHFESVNFKTPDWARGMKCVATVGKFNFYKP